MPKSILVALHINAEVHILPREFASQTSKPASTRMNARLVLLSLMTQVEDVSNIPCCNKTVPLVPTEPLKRRKTVSK